VNIRLRLAREEDYPLTMAWRSNPLVYKGFYQQEEPLIWEGHIAWYGSRNKDWRSFIVIYEERPVGCITIGQLDHWQPEIGWYIGEVSLWGKGVGREAVNLGLEYLKSLGYESCHTTILKDNMRSLQLAKSLGFKESGDARDGEIWVVIQLGEQE